MREGGDESRSEATPPRDQPGADMPDGMQEGWRGETGSTGLPRGIEEDFIEQVRDQIDQRHGIRETALQALSDAIACRDLHSVRISLTGKNGDSGLLYKGNSSWWCWTCIRRDGEAARNKRSQPRRASQALPGGSRKFGGISPQEGLARRKREQTPDDNSQIVSGTALIAPAPMADDDGDYIPF